MPSPVILGGGCRLPADKPGTLLGKIRVHLVRKVKDLIIQPPAVAFFPKHRIGEKREVGSWRIDRAGKYPVHLHSVGEQGARSRKIEHGTDGEQFREIRLRLCRPAGKKS